MLWNARINWNVMSENAGASSASVIRNEWIIVEHSRRANLRWHFPRGHPGTGDVHKVPRAGRAADLNSSASRGSIASPLANVRCNDEA